MRILLTGATGFIGKAVLERLLFRGDSVTALTRQEPKTLAERPNLRFAKWDPRSDGAWQNELEGHDAIVHLAGESAVGMRWNDEVKKQIRDSRVESTERIVTAFTRVSQKPRVLLCASGAGFYGGRSDAEPLDESSPPGRDFLAHVCIDWEDAAHGAERYGARVVSARIGFVLGKGGGALGKLVPIFKKGIGGRIGSGKQMVPWIHIDDVVGGILHAIADPTVLGPMNLSAPHAVSNADFTVALAKALGKSAPFPVPPFALKLLYGEGALPILTGQNALPRVLQEHGYPFRFPTLEAALTDIFK